MTIPFGHIDAQSAAKQPNSRMCFVCGLENPAGLHAHFYQLDEYTCLGRFLPAPHHQGYPGRVHGGIVAAMLDETMGRAIWSDQTAWGVTAELTIRYKVPTPMGEMLTVVGRITESKGRVFLAEGSLMLADGAVAVTASGKFIRLSLDTILQEGADSLDPALELFVVPEEHNL
jgi:acyl-coenzyme A thioesterase PaaI-like protein